MPATEPGIDYVYLRDNPRGRYDEYWHHTSGCRRWLVVERDTVTHDDRSLPRMPRQKPEVTA